MEPWARGAAVGVVRREHVLKGAQTICAAGLASGVREGHDDYRVWAGNNWKNRIANRCDREIARRVLEKRSAIPF